MTSRRPHKRKYPRTCEVCGKKFKAMLPHGRFHSIECYNASRRVGYKRPVQAIEPEEMQPETVVVTCLKCGDRFASTSKFIRTCPRCKELNRNANHLADWCRVQTYGG